MNASGDATLPALAVDHAIYTKAELAREVRQSEILTGLTQYVYDPVSGDVEAIPHGYVIIATQDCDLLWDYEAHLANKPLPLNGVLIYGADPAAVARAKISGGSDIWRRVIANNDVRYHFLEKIPITCDAIGEGLPPLVIDFKRCFTVSHREILRQCGTEGVTKRRCRLHTPYREHFQCRLAYYIQRVMLPEQHNTTIE